MNFQTHLSLQSYSTVPAMKTMVSEMHSAVFKMLLHSTSASGIRLYSLLLLELSEQRPWPSGWERLIHGHQTSDGEKEFT